jgi:hypothetical protein
MNSIPNAQIEPKQLERLAAMRELYSSAKVWHGWQIILTVIIPIILAILSITNEKYSLYSALFGILSFFVDAYFIENNISLRKEKAAKIQELFDCDVLRMPSSQLKVSNDIKVEEVLTHYDAHSKIPTNIELIERWYSEEVGDVPLYIARIICQRANCRWDGALRERFTAFLNYLGVFLFISVLIIGFKNEMKPVTMVLVISGLIPFFQFCIKQYNDNKNSIKRLDELYDVLTNVWDDAIVKCIHPDVLLAESRRIQDEIFTHRSSNPLIFDFIYKVFREGDEKIMNISSKRLVEDALASKCLKSIQS